MRTENGLEFWAQLPRLMSGQSHEFVDVEAVELKCSIRYDWIKPDDVFLTQQMPCLIRGTKRLATKNDFRDWARPLPQSTECETFPNSLHGLRGTEAQHPDALERHGKGSRCFNQCDHRGVVRPDSTIDEWNTIDTSESREVRRGRRRRHGNTPGFDAVVTLQSCVMRRPEDVNVVVREAVGWNHKPLDALTERPAAEALLESLR